MCAIGRLRFLSRTTRPHTLSQPDSSILFEVSAVKSNLIKVAYTRLNFGEVAFIPPH